VCYVPGDPNGRPFYFYAHGDVQSGGPGGIDSCQETFLFTSADLVSIVSEGVAIPSGNFSNAYINHTGYAAVFPPNTLPGQTAWQAGHLGWSQLAIEYMTPSSDGKTFLTNDAPEELDYCTPFPAGFDLVQWRDNIFPMNGKFTGSGVQRKAAGGHSQSSRLIAACIGWRMARCVDSGTDLWPTIGFAGHFVSTMWNESSSITFSGTFRGRRRRTDQYKALQFWFFSRPGRSDMADKLHSS
jgi:hypothetical protein